MVRKRNLSDLLRDEAESLDADADPPAAEQTIEVSAEPAADEPVADEPTADEAAEGNEEIEPARRTHQPTKAELQAIVTDLTVELEAVRDRSQQLERELAELKAERETDQAQIEQLRQQADQFKQQLDQAQQSDSSAELAQAQQRLEAELAQTAQLKSELEEARQLILKLSEANSKPPEKSPEKPLEKPIDRPASTSQRAPLQAKPLPQRGGAIQPARPPAPPARPTVQPRPFVPVRPVAPNNVPYMPSERDTRLTDADIGWVD